MSAGGIRHDAAGNRRAGSLATILWLATLKREGPEVNASTFLKLGVHVMPPALLLAIGGLFLF